MKMIPIQKYLQWIEEQIEMLQEYKKRVDSEGLKPHLPPRM